ncbi:hypothetical protein EXU57_10215 [Segetibacter sp. 3557_3]|uniref:hypothetical protein n=1 Tax=Segetibacter sp. 3557_3 TaxID=2547429 RepID=UPI001058B8F1|nr:hypothetical protein [Segetibacter sp. 3557_3]TDH26462.1 hypothetical protein EXU57_10215 [Segetibacter sp. 3557_3]
MSFHQNIVSRFSAKTLVLSAVAFTTMSSFEAPRLATPDFSGEWKLNETKSELGQFGARMASRTMKITLENEGFNFEKAGSNPQGEALTMKDRLTFDGKETESTVFGNTKKKSTAKWAEDGQTLNVNSVILLEMNGESTEIKLTETYKLSSDGQSLVLDSKSSSSFGENAMKLVYEKAK